MSFTPSNAIRLRQHGALLRRAAALALLWAAVACLSGCRGPGDVDTEYGRRRGATGERSVNGVAVLSEMFRQSGHKVSSWRRLSPRLERCDTLVWAPDTFAPPSEAERAFLDQWLRSRPGRRLIYIGRDFDAAWLYWGKMAPQAEPEVAAEMLLREARARAAYDAARQREMPNEQFTPWFTVRRNGIPRRVTRLEGPWAKGIDPAQAEIYLAGRLDPAKKSDAGRTEGDPFPAETLLDSERGPLVLRVRQKKEEESAIVAVANGSFLLNVPLVNHEHRKLAARLIDECGQPGEVVFLESGAEGLPVSDDAEGPASDFPFWPIGVILLHWMAALAVVLCARSPIFGRAARLPPASRADFGRHIAALGELLERINDESLARSRLEHYHRHVRRESGASHAGAAAARHRQGRLKITIALPGNATPGPDELEHRQRLERLLLRRRLGAVVARDAGPGAMSLTLLVKDVESGQRKVEAVLREVGMDRDARVEAA